MRAVRSAKNLTKDDIRREWGVKGKGGRDPNTSMTPLDDDYC